MIKIVLTQSAAVLVSGMLSLSAAAQTGSFWRGLIDANIPIELYAEQFNAEGLKGKLTFGAARFGFADTNRLCDSATITATNGGDGRFEYTVTGRCRGSGWLMFEPGNREKLVGQGTLYDAAYPSGRKRRHFYLLRQ